MAFNNLIDITRLQYFLEKLKALIPSTYASSKSAGGYADKALSVPIATVDSTSTSTVFTVQVAEFANETGPRDGMFFYIRNNKVASASGWTLNVNGWGGRPVYNTSAERTTTGFALNRIFPCWYDSTLATDGCWVIGYLTDTNTTYSSFVNLNHNTGAGRLADSAIYRYQLLFEKDEDHLTPLNNVSNGYNKTNKAMLTNVEFDPFGEIVYWYSSGTVAAGDRARGDYLNYTFGALDLRYTFNCGSTLTAYKPFYLVVDIGSNGKAKIASTTPWAQELPTESDGHYYIFLGRTYSTYQMSLYPCHPVYYHDGTTIRQYLPVDAKSVNGHTVLTNVPANAVFTDTTYESKAAASGGTAVSLVTTGEKYTWNSRGLPSGGSAGQVLKKSSATNYAVEWGNASGAQMVVTVTRSGSTVSADKTFSEINSAYQNGSQIIALYGSEPNIYTLNKVSSSLIEFVYADVISSGITQYLIRITSSNVSNVYQNHIPSPPAHANSNPIFVIYLDETETPSRYRIDFSQYDDISYFFGTDTSTPNRWDLVTLQLWNSGKNSYADPIENADYDEFKLTHAYTTSSTDEYGNASYVGHLIFSAIAIENGQKKLKTFELVSNFDTYEYLDDATVTYSEEILGSGGTMTISISGFPPNTTTDKTFSEAYAAYQNGSMLFANWNGNFYRLSGVSSTSISFTNISVTDDVGVGSSTLTYSSSGAISLSSAGVVKSTPLIIPLLCDDLSDYMDPPSGTLSIAYSNDISDITYESTKREVILVNGYDPYDTYGTYSCDKYHIVSTVFTPGASGDPDTLTIIFRCLGSRNGTSIIKTIILSGEVYSGVIAVSYSEEPAGSGSMPVNAAVIHVNAPLGSAITFFKGSTVMEAVTAAQTHPNADGKTEDYYYSVPTSDFGSWTVVASKSGENDATQLFSILVAKQYDAMLSYLAPYDFQAIEWLQTSAASCYFDTGIDVTTNTIQTEVYCETVGYSQDYDLTLFGAACGYAVIANGYRKRWSFCYATSSWDWDQILTYTYTEGTDYHLIYNTLGGAVNLDDVNVAGSRNRLPKNTNYPRLYIGRYYNPSNGNYYYGQWRYKRFIVSNTSTGEILADFQPCYRKADHVIGFWDHVSNAFFVNLGTGTLTAGPDI